MAIINPSRVERNPPENCIIHKISTGKERNNRIYGIKLTKANIIVAVIKADDRYYH